MERTNDPMPQDESAERQEDEESMRYPEHGDPETLRERSGLADREQDAAPSPDVRPS